MKEGRRSDAMANRARILAAARTAAGTTGWPVMSRIARAAGVGPGTLYRHFPTREVLITEVYRDDVDELVSLATVLLAQHEPLTALRLWFDRVAEYVLLKRGVFAAVDAALSQELSSHSHGPISKALTALLQAGTSADLLREDADARDVLLLMTSLMRVDEAESEVRTHRLLDIVLQGLRRQA